MLKHVIFQVVLPVLLYGCEIWGFEKLDIIERVHLKFLKTVLNLRSTTPNFMIYGETGRYPLYIIVYTRIITYWGKMLISPENKIVYTDIYFHNILIAIVKALGLIVFKEF